GHVGGFRTVTDNDHVEVDIALPQYRVDRPPQLVGPFGLRQQHAGDPRVQRNLLEVRMLSRCPITTMIAIGINTISNTLLPSIESVTVSPIAASTTSPLSSIASSAL